MKHLKKLVLAGAFALTSLVVGNSMADSKPTLKLGYVQGWDDSVASATVAAQVIEKRLGYPVKLIPAAPGIMWGGVARGDLDIILAAALPNSHAAYWERYKDQVQDLGANCLGAKIGLVVPDYVSIDSIADLSAHKADFSGRIVGIDAGAGIMKKAADAIKVYNLDYQLLPSSGPAMVAELSRSINSHKPVVVTGWIPHWMFAKWKLKFLQDPKSAFGDGDHYDSVVNPSLDSKAPSVVAFLKKFQWKPGELDSIMLATENGAKPEDAAASWIAAHGERVNTWVGASQ